MIGPEAKAEKYLMPGNLSLWMDGARNQLFLPRASDRDQRHAEAMAELDWNQVHWSPGEDHEKPTQQTVAGRTVLKNTVKYMAHNYLASQLH